MQIHVNGQSRALPEGCSVAALLETMGLAGRRVAVEVNRQIVPRSLHASHILTEGDQVELVHAMGGG